MQTLLASLNSRAYWWFIAWIGLGLIGVALYYQYVLGEEPCQVCIQARLWVIAFILTALVMIFTSRIKLVSGVANLMVMGCAVGLGNRAWILYQLENGVGHGSCEFQLGMPDWLAVDRWFPALFEVRNLCSFTPDMWFGLSMAEGLVIAASVIGFLALAGLLASLRGTPQTARP